MTPIPDASGLTEDERRLRADASFRHQFEVISAKYQQWFEQARLLELALDAARTEIAALQQRVEEAETENARLAKLVYVPGLLRCAKCDFRQISTTLFASSGTFAANNEPVSCPNDGAPMWRVSERDAGNEMCDRWEVEHNRAEAAEAKLDALRALPVLRWQLQTLSGDWIDVEEIVAKDSASRGLSVRSLSVHSSHYRDPTAEEAGNGGS